MQNQKLWTTVGIAVALGIAVQLLKGPMLGQPRINGIKVAGLLDEGQAVYVPGGADDASPFGKKPAPVQHVRVLAPHMSPAAKPTPAPVKKEDPKKKAEEEKKKAEEAKKKKAADLKKKKALARKKAKEDQARRQAAADALKAADDKKKGNSDSGTGSDLSGTGGAIGGAAAGAAAPAKSLPQTAEEWEAYLMNAPSVDHLETFIKAYQTGLVTSDIFYQVVSAMLADPRVDVQSQAVSALGATPSANSFAALIAIDKNTSYPTRIVTLARAFERQYQRLENLRFLAASVTNTDSTNQPVAYIAITMMSTSAQTYLVSSSSSSSATATSTSSTTATSSTTSSASTAANVRNAKYYVSVLAALKAAEAWPDVNVASAALTTYKQISALMPTTTSTTSTGTSTSTSTTTASGSTTTSNGSTVTKVN